MNKNRQSKYLCASYKSLVTKPRKGDIVHHWDLTTVKRDFDTHCYSVTPKQKLLVQDYIAFLYFYSKKNWPILLLVSFCTYLPSMLFLYIMYYASEAMRTARPGKLGELPGSAESALLGRGSASPCVFLYIITYYYT